MSGLEIASAVVGVLPILIEVVKSYSSVSRSLKTLRNYSREVRTIQCQYRVHHGIFMNECRLLLRLIEDERGAKDMLEDENDQRWNSTEVNSKLNSILRDNLDLCIAIIETSKETVESIKEDLARFDVPTAAYHTQGESGRASIRRLRDAFRITFDKSKYERSLASLREHNEELSLLRSQIGAFEQQKLRTDGGHVGRTLPPRIRTIRSASQKLHEALTDAWRCEDQTHGSHYAKICLDAEVREEVRLDLAISCHETSHQNDHGHSSEPPIWLFVQSVRLDATAGSSEPQQILAKSCKRPLEDDMTHFMSVGSSNASTEPNASIVSQKKNKNSVRFTATSEASQSISLPELYSNSFVDISEIAAKQATPTINLCHTKNICHYLKQNLQICESTFSSHCVGYLESPMTYRHVFYLQQNRVTPSVEIKDSGQTSIFSVFDLMEGNVDDVLNVEDQLKLAYKTALALLQFNSTPWLRERWRLRNFNYFGKREVFDESALKTLHLSSLISSGTTQDAAMEERGDAVQPFSDEIVYGINNTALFFLGVALLELAHWKPLEGLRNEKDPNEIVTARRLASRSSPLGSRYQKIARKCIQCDFGFGDQLQEQTLQEAVYRDVICELEMMMKALST